MYYERVGRGETLDDDGSLLNRRMEEGPMGDYQPLVGGKAP